MDKVAEQLHCSEEAIGKEFSRKSAFFMNKVWRGRVLKTVPTIGASI